MITADAETEVNERIHRERVKAFLQSQNADFVVPLASSGTFPAGDSPDGYMSYGQYFG